MSPEQAYCQHCNHTFDAGDVLQARCPLCMRSSAITRTGVDQQSSGGSKSATFIGVAALALVGGGLLWYVQNSKVEPPQQIKPGSTEVVTAKDDSAAKRGADSKEDPTGEDAEIIQLAKTLTAGASSSNNRVIAIRQALEKRIKILSEEGRLGRNGLTPAQLAKSWSRNKDSFTLTKLEAGFLALRLIQSLGIEASAISHVGTPSSAILVRQRNLRIRYTGSNGEKSQFVLHQKTLSQAKSTPVLQPSSYEPAMLAALDALFAVETHDFETASKRMGDALASAPDDSSLRFMRGQIAILRGEADAGLQEMQAAVEKNEDAAGRYHLAVAFLRSEQRFKAFQALRRSVSIDPGYAEAWNALAQVTLERLETAPEIQKQAIQDELARIESALAKIGSNAPGLIELRVQRLLIAEKQDEAIQLLTQSLAAHPKRASLHMLMANFAQRAGDSTSLYKHLQAAADVDKEDAEPLVILSGLLKNDGKPKEAIVALKAAVDRSPYDPDLLAQLAAYYQEDGDTELARATAKQLVERFPEHLGGPMLLAQIAVLSGQHKEAERLLLGSIKKHKREPSIYVLLYFTYMGAGNKVAALKVASDLAKIEPNGRMRIAEQLLQSGQVEMAVELMEAENKANPTRLEVVISLAQLLFVSGQKDKLMALKKSTSALVEDKSAFETLFDQAMDEMTKQLKNAGAAAE